MTSIALSKKDIESSFEQILWILNEKEKDIIKRRIGINWEKETLQVIWESYTPPITRERVRQIENLWINKIWKTSKSALVQKIQQIATWFIKLHSEIISTEKLINILLKELNISKDINIWILDIIIQSIPNINKSKAKLWVKNYYYNKEFNKNCINIIHKQALKILKRKKDVMDKNSLYQLIKLNIADDFDIDIIRIDSVINLFNDIIIGEENLIWLTKWKILNPITVKDKTIYVLKKEWIPMHFVDITNKISEMTNSPIKIATVHNELIRSNDFVLVGRWVYWLKEKWFTPWTIMDVMINILKKHWEPMSSEQIIKEVLKHRKVQPTTVYMNIQNKNFIERVWRNFYQLKPWIE